MIDRRQFLIASAAGAAAASLPELPALPEVAAQPVRAAENSGQSSCPRSVVPVGPIAWSFIDMATGEVTASGIVFGEALPNGTLVLGVPFIGEGVELSFPPPDCAALPANR